MSGDERYVQGEPRNKKNVLGRERGGVNGLERGKEGDDQMGKPWFGERGGAAARQKEKRGKMGRDKSWGGLSGGKADY